MSGVSCLDRDRYNVINRKVSLIFPSTHSLVREHRWFLLPLVVAGLMVMRWPLAPDHDLYLHLKSGELIARTKTVLSLDPFTFTEVNHPNETHSWLSQWIFWSVYRGGGETALRLLNLAVVTSLLLLVYRFVFLRTRERSAAFLASVLALFVHHEIQVLRPLLFGELCFAILLFWILEKDLRGRPARVAASLGLLILWANLHGSCYLGFVILVFYWLSTLNLKEKFWWSPPLAAAGAVGLCPGGWSGLGRTLELGELAQASGIWEWQPLKPFFVEQAQFWISLTPASLFWLGLFILLFFFGRAGRKSFENGTAFFLLFLPLLSFRHFGYLLYPAAWLVILVARSTVLGCNLRRRAFALVALAFILGGGLTRTGFVAPSIEHTLNFMASTGLTGKVLNFPGYGSEIIYRLFPQVTPGFDRRIWVHRDYYREEAEQIRTWGGIRLETMASHYPQANLALYPASAPISRLTERNWTLIYANNEAALLLKNIPENRDNFARVAQFYSDQKIPFDAVRGFDPERVLTANAAWVNKNQEMSRK